MNIVVKKWIEPYVLLETSKKLFQMRDFTFNGYDKDEVKTEFLTALSKETGTAFGLYMKNVNKFYLFYSSDKIDIPKTLLEENLNFSSDDFEYAENSDIPINLVDIGKAEAGIIILD